MVVPLHAATDEVGRGFFAGCMAAVQCRCSYGAPTGSGSPMHATIDLEIFDISHLPMQVVVSWLPQVRDRIVPVNKRWPLAELIATMEVG